MTTRQVLADVGAELMEFQTALRDHIADKFAELDGEDGDDIPMIQTS